MAPFLTSLAVAILLVLTKPWHRKFTTKTAPTDHGTHTKAIPRIGGLALLAGMVVARYEQPSLELMQHCVGFGLVVFGIGFIEDLAHRITARQRLLMCLIGGALAAGYGQHVVREVGLAPIDALLGFHQIALLFSAFAIAGLCSAVNMIDGKNGLAGGSAVISLLGIYAIAQQSGAPEIAATALAMVWVTLGFLAINWPWGRLFMGDGGAYLLGFATALCLIELGTSRGVSPWASLLLVAYPVTEALHTMWRRLRRRRPIADPDTGHLHHLLQRSVIDRLVPQLGGTGRNSATVLGLWLLNLPPVLVAVRFADSAVTLMAAFLAFVVLYASIFRWLESAQSARARP